MLPPEAEDRLVNYVELHFHLLPGLDDGPSCVQESIELALAASRDGTRTIVATPHVHPAYRTAPGAIAEAARELRGLIRAERLPISVLAGAELSHEMVARLSQQELETIAQGPPGRRWLLLEAPFAGLDGSFTEAADELRARRFGIVVAHPERTPLGSRAARAALDHELRAGSALQLNAWSLTGQNGGDARSVALALLREGHPAVLASDAHGGDRMPSLSSALIALAAAGERAPRRLAASNPRALLERGLRPRQSALAA